MELSALRDLCREWQGILGLQDWDITVDLVPLSDVKGQHFGDVTWTIEKKQAEIRIVFEDQLPKDLKHPHSYEKTLVHELVHLHLAPWSRRLDDGSIEDIVSEQAVNAITLGYIKLRG